MSEEQQVDEIRKWFADRGYELIVHPVSHGGFFAPYIRFESRLGSASFTWGRTAVEAAEAARAQFEHETKQSEAGS
jgi:predicted negative regulator of RcsB-dependent stress response